MNLIGLDFGTSRIGVAICTEDSKNPKPLDTWNKAQGEAEKKLIEYIEKTGNVKLIIGLPLSESGEETPICAVIRNFCRRIAKRLKIEMFFVDENGSSEEVKERFKDLNKKIPEELDAYAACIILERFLEPSKDYHIGYF